MPIDLAQFLADLRRDAHIWGISILLAALLASVIGTAFAWWLWMPKYDGFDPNRHSAWFVDGWPEDR
jgi:hypothetical protein